MAGEEFLPQTSILPRVDAVITHGGNNTVTETGFGLRLDTYHHEPEELLGAVDAVLADEAMRARLAAASARLQAVRGTEVAAELIERTAAG